MKLLPHNKKTLTELETFDKYNMNCCVVNPCGSGKTAIMAAFIEQHPHHSFTVLTKQKNAKQYYQQKHKVFKKPNVNIVTYTKMLNDYRQQNTSQYNTTYFLIDEAHYLGAPQWRIAFEFLKETYKPKLIGFTATPQRYTDRFTNNDIVQTFFDNNRAGNYTNTDLEADGVFVKPEYVLSIYNLPKIINNISEKIKTSDVEDTVKQRLYNKLDAASTKWCKESMPQKIFKQYIPKYLYKKKSNRILVYIANLKELESKKQFIESTLTTTFPKKNIVSYVYTYKSSETELQRFLQNDDDIDIKVLYSIDKIMETIHIDDLRILIMLRPSVSTRIIIQQFGRINSIKNKKQPLIIDMVDNLSILNKYTNIQSHQKSIDSNTTESNTTINISMPHITYYADLFATIDNTISQIQPYTYRGYTGTLTNICKIFDLDINQLKKSLKTTADIEEAIAQTPTKKHNLKHAPVDMSNHDRQFELTPEEKIITEEHLKIVDTFICNHQITDDDIIQELYMTYLYTIHIYHNSTQATPLSRRVQAELNREYIRCYRNKIRHDDLYTDIPVDQVDDEPLHDPYLYTVHNDVHQKLQELFNTLLTQREMQIIQLRYGWIDGRSYTFNEIGHILNLSLSRARIGQIEIETLKKLRQHSRRKHLLEGYLNDYA